MCKLSQVLGTWKIPIRHHNAIIRCGVKLQHSRMTLLAILIAFTVPLIRLAVAGSEPEWESLMFRYIATKSIHSIDAFLCSPKDGFRIYKQIATPSGCALPVSFLRVIDNFDIENVNLDQRTGIFVDFSCEQNRKQLGLVNDQLFTNNFGWLIWDPEELFTDSYHELPLSTYSDVSIGSHKRIVRLHRHRSGAHLIYRDVGVWDSETEQLSITPWNVRVDYQKATVNGAIMFIDDIYDRNVLLQQLQDDQFKPGNDVSNRFIYGNTLHLAYLYNFTLNLKETRNWGDKSSNGTWNGLIGLLQSHEADLTITPLLPLSQRMEVSYCSIPTLPYWMAVIFKQPRALGSYRAMILELSPITWAFLGLLIVSGAIVFTVTLKHGSHEGKLYSTDASLTMAFVQSIGIMANQGLTIMPKCNPGRITCISLLAVGLIVSNAYNAATMTALLSKSPPVIKSLEQLMSSKTPIRALDAPYVHLKQSRKRVFRGVVVDRMDKDFGVCNLNEGIKSMMNGSAFLGEYFVLFRGITENLQSDVICDLAIFNAGFHQNAVSFIKKCPHFRELYTRGMLRTLEHGLMPKERQRWIAGQPLCTRKTAFIHVRLEAVTVAFAIFLIGMGVSAILVILELLLGRRNRWSWNIEKGKNKHERFDRKFSSR